MKTTIFQTLIAATAFGYAVTAHATQLGMNTDPGGSAWDRGISGSAHAVWDQFPAITFNNYAPDSGSSNITLPRLSQTGVADNFSQSVGLYDVASSVPAAPNTSGDVLFLGNNPLNVVLTGTVQFTVRGVVLQVKRPNSLGTLSDQLVPMLSIDGSSAVSANSFSTSSGTGDTNSDTGNYTVTSWFWGAAIAGLPDDGTSNFSITIDRNAFQRNLDGFALDLANVAIPEPGSSALLAAAALALSAARRRNSHRRHAW